MSRVINIKGKVIIQNMQIAQDAISELGFKIKIKNRQFIFNKYDAYDRINANSKADEISQVESLYVKNFNIYLEKIAEEERVKLEEEKRIIREEKADLIIKNAKKQGYKLKKQIKKDNTIQLVMQKRIY